MLGGLRLVFEMPSSQHYHISKIMGLIISVDPRSILDIGAGFGKYGVLCREYLELWDGRYDYSQFLRRIDGVEVFAEYITPLHEFVYDRMYIGDIVEVLDEIEPTYELVLLIDVLEHFEKQRGEMLLRSMLQRNEGVLVSTPREPSSQKAVFGNPYEIHRSRWTREELSSLAPSLFIADEVSQIAYLGNAEGVTRVEERIRRRKARTASGRPADPSRADRLVTKLGRLGKIT